MKITVIYACKPTTLTIVTSNAADSLRLLKMGSDGQPVTVCALRPGVKTAVSVDPGVYKVMTDAVRVTPDATSLSSDITVMAIDNKDDPPPDQPKMTIMFDKVALRTFLVDAMGSPVPR
jgi:hypothetical protein